MAMPLERARGLNTSDSEYDSVDTSRMQRSIERDEVGAQAAYRNLQARLGGRR
ncbi:MAG: hypothetical protein MJZ26_11440 [Fibrobacter sp.]|nr:hypothetical protein [Fibrobacter sp.]